MSVAFKITNPIRLIELFAGIGSQAMALKEIGADFETYRVVEFDKYAIASYNAIHGTNFSTMDITKIKGSDLGIVDTDKFTYLLTYSFPCQDLSVAGKGRGMAKGSGTRSGLLWEVERLLNETENLPQILVMENVPQVHSKKNMPDFQNWLNYLELRGYKTFWQDVNAMNCGIPQSRNRCIAVSILGDYSFEFPAPIPLTTVMKDFLESEVDEKYYLSTDKAKELIDKLILNGKIDIKEVKKGEASSSITLEAPAQNVNQTQNPQTYHQVSYSGIIKDSTTMEAVESLSVQELGFIERGTGKHQSNTVYGSDELSPTLTAASRKDPLQGD